ncbi:acyl-CoA thioesterase [Paenibacillus gansuensis]|uniref:Acyl-CoA thioesterase n=1 Tax=Paenibacillus gansuensis TaxID=306542 RepID=A0ABW5PDR0_9BACL
METRWFSTRFRVRYQETDRMGIVYHANYLTWMEIGRTELIRELGMTYQSLEEKGLLLPVVDAAVSYKMPARYDDMVTVWTSVHAYSHVRMEFRSQIRRDLPEEEEAANPILAEPTGELLAEGATKHVWVNAAWRPVRIDREASELYEMLRKLSEDGK